MGLYTGFQVDVVVKNEYIDLAKWICLINEKKYYSEERFKWQDVLEKTGYDFVEKYIRQSVRTHFIPRGSGGCVKGFGETYCRFDTKNNRLMFCCTLKNYDQEIEKFTYYILKPIVKDILMIRKQPETNGSPYYLSFEKLKHLSSLDFYFSPGGCLRENLFQMSREYETFRGRWD